ncbi:MAG: hypothetical protein GY847_26270 [Proteobacteria bacterium]|nr:hypothetical protein [Pseudomonadota bacterium]
MLTIRSLIFAMAVAFLWCHGCFYDPDRDKIGIEKVTGLGEECEDTDDCVGFEAEHCLYNPGDNDAGMCTIEDCDSDDCPGGYKCCDCSQSGIPDFNIIACIPDELAYKLIIYCDCP